MRRTLLLPRWPAGSGAWPAGTTPCTGGFLRSVSTFAQNQSEAETIDGFASQILCLGGSGNPLVTFFPHPSFDPPSGPPPPQSFFWNCLGQNVMDPEAFTSTESVNNMEAYRDNMLLPTHFDDYASNLSIPVYSLTYVP